jgi:hypothetical protein
MVRCLIHFNDVFALADYVQENLRPVLVHAGAIVGLFNMLTSDDAEVHMAAVEYILDLIEYGTLFLLGCRSDGYNCATIADDTRLAIIQESTLKLDLVKMLEKPHASLSTASFFAGLAKHGPSLVLSYCLFPSPML